MKIDLRKVFQPVTKNFDEATPIATIICDVYDTLIFKDRSFNENLAEFLKWADDNGITVLIASSLKEDAEKDLRTLDTKGLLSNIAVHHKDEIQSWFLKEDPAVLAVDDQSMIWLGAAMLYTPSSPALKKIVEEKSYLDCGFTL